MSRILQFLILFQCLLKIVSTSEDEANLSVAQIITKYGYPCEEYHVTTPDGYILAMQRIPHDKSNDTFKGVVFVMHGLLCSSADYIMSGPNRALGYLLADEGYDVWMGNARGSKLSRSHTRLNPDTSAEFWDFSWHEIGYYDVPTMIDFVLEKTKEKSLFHLGHSQGTATFFVMTSLKPEYNKKIRAHVSMAPIAYMGHMTSPLLKVLAFWQEPLAVLLDLIGIWEFLPNNEFMALGGNTLCGDDSVTQALCTNALFAICGFSPKEMNASLLPVVSGHTPAGASTKQFLHFAQEITSGYFRSFDYGLMGNWEKYGMFWPPSYNLSKVTVPVYLIYSHNDWLAAEEDVIRLHKELGNCKGRFLVRERTFNHLDYLYGINARELVYKKLLALITQH